MEVPEGLHGPEKENVVCRLHKALYGLKQASRCWHHRIAAFLAYHGFCVGESEKSLYIGSVDGESAYIILFVDDGLIFARTKEALNKIVSILKTDFEITVNEPCVFVGIEIERNGEKHEIIIRQSKYAKRVVDRFCLQEAKIALIPIEKGLSLERAEYNRVIEIFRIVRL